MNMQIPERMKRVGEIGIVDYLPDPLFSVIVHTEKYSCQAYLDHQGIWRNQFTDEPVNARVLSWEEI